MVFMKLRAAALEPDHTVVELRRILSATGVLEDLHHPKSP